MVFKWAIGLDVTRRGFETDRALVKVAVDMDVSEFPALEAGFMVVGVVGGGVEFLIVLQGRLCLF